MEYFWSASSYAAAYLPSAATIVSTVAELNVPGGQATLIAAGAVGGTIVGAVAIPATLSVIGFGAGGIVAGSIAATAQSIIYGGATCGIFSALTSAGAAGIGGLATAAAAAGGAAVGAAAVGGGAAVINQISS
eukprot:TRINITY_DN2566_c0_g1_i2.p2 TRINITY_DN2566_c0_g1~~TRINITY_DN2566_c0_g1_i2.p2  ORF type:complete len:148 (-),score=33.93 TRINITY_DN2566_c0_g1_i2:80-478(-)